MTQLNATELMDAIKSGKTLYIQTATTITPINSKTVAAFDRAGVPVLKNGKDGHLYLAQGRRYVDCHYAHVFLR